MQKISFYPEIVSLARTTDELARLTEEVSRLEESLFSAEADHFAAALKTKIRGKTALVVEKIMAETKLAPADVLIIIKKELQKLRPFRITLAIEPSIQLVEAICAWVRENINGYAILAVEYKPILIGGAQFTWRGKFVDLSLEKKLDDCFSDSHAKL